MAHSLIWLPDVLLAAGLRVAKVDGWENRGRGDVGQIKGVICHHTAGPKNGIMPSLNTLINGRTGLPGPLSQLGLGRDGTYFVIAAGRCNHAGTGSWQGITTGNTNFIGIEAENTGLTNDQPWPEVQMDAYRRGVAAILMKIGQDVKFCAGHKEYTRRKTDPTFDMDAFRLTVAAIMNGTMTPPVLIPRVTPNGRPTLRRGASGKLVKEIQAKVGVVVDGKFGSNTEAAVRAFQRAEGFTPDGIVGPKTWGALDRVAMPVPVS